MNNNKERFETATALVISNTDKVEIERAAPLERIPSNCASSGALNGEHLRLIDFVQHMLTSAPPTNDYAKKLPNSVPDSVAVPESPGVDRRRGERRKSKQPFSHNVNNKHGSSRLESSSVTSSFPQGHREGLATRKPMENGFSNTELDDRSLAGDDLDPTRICIVSNRQNLLALLLPALARRSDILATSQPIDQPALFLTLLKEWRPKLLLLDTAVPDHLITEYLRIAQSKISAIRILIIGDELRTALVDEILRHRIHGSLLTSDPPEIYVKAIRAVARGELWLPRAVLAKAFSDSAKTCPDGDAKAESGQANSNAMDSLTKRERQIADFLTQGLSNKQIARELGIVEDTVKKHLRNIFRKLDVHCRTLVVMRQVGGQ